MEVMAYSSGIFVEEHAEMFEILAQGCFRQNAVFWGWIGCKCGSRTLMCLATEAWC